MKPNKVIALTGGIGSGKSKVAQILQSEGCFVLDCDQITKQLYQKQGVLDMIADNFGKNFVVGGKLDVKNFAAQVFADGAQVQKLNGLMHPLIFAEMDRQIAESGQKTVFVQIPLLFETGAQDRFDEVWLITAPESVRVRRVKARDGIDEEQIKNRIKNQMSDEKKAEFAHTIINNDGDEQKLSAAVKDCVKGLL